MLDDTSTAYLAAISHGDQDEANRLAAVLDAATLLDRQLLDNPHRIRLEALRLAREGIPVFPIQPRGKRPLTKHGFKDATIDEAVIDGWFTQWPDANLGVPTGIGFDVVDIDGREGIISVYGGTSPLIDTLTVLGVAFTSRDAGRHIYVPAAGRGNRTAIYPGVDYRGQGGYVVAPPSIGANGRRYEWTQRLNVAAAASAA